jgi:hypothetical protein
MTLFNLYICPTEVILRLLHRIQFHVKRSDKKQRILKIFINILEFDSLSKIKKGEIKKINKDEELKRLEKEEDNKISCCFEVFLRHKCLFC